MKLKDHISHDFKSAVVVFIVALPLCLGIALASGAPLFSGLISGIVGAIIVGSLSGSPLSVTGPAAGLATIVLATITQLGFEAFLLSVFLAGIFQIILGYVRAGSIGRFVPESVIKGMLASIGIILILKQVPHAIGYDVDFEGDQSFLQFDGKNTFSEIAEAFTYLTPGAIAISIISIVILIAWDSDRLQRLSFFKTMPGPIFVVMTAVLLNAFFTWVTPDLAVSGKHLVFVPELLGTNLSSIITYPDFTQILNPEVIVAAVVITCVASVETLLNVEATDRLDPFQRVTPLNRELKAQGVANAILGLLGGLPVTSVVVRSSANIQAGARTKASTIVHGFILLVALVFLGQVLNLIPLASVAGILIVIGYRLTRPALYKKMLSKGIDQFLPFVVTLVAVVLTNLMVGVFLGLLVSVFFILKANFQKSIIVVNDGNNYLMKFTKDVSFVHKDMLRNILRKIPPNSSVVIDGSKSSFVDQDVKETIEDFIKTSKGKNIDVELKKIDTQ